MRLIAWVTIFSAAVVPVFFTALPLILRLATSILVFAALLASYRRAGWMGGARAIRSAVWDADGRWLLSRAGKTWEAKLRGTSWVSARAMLLRWQAVNGSEPHVSMLITVSDVGTVVFRRLAIRLRIAGTRATAVADSLLA